MYIVDVIPLQKGIPRDTLSYFSARPIPLGSVVDIPLHSRTITGIVITQHEARDIKSSIRSGTFSLKSVTRVHTDISFPKKLLEVIATMSTTTLIPAGTLVTHFFSGETLDFFVRHAPSEKNAADMRIINLPQETRWNYYLTLASDGLQKNNSVVIIAPTALEVAELETFLKHRHSDRVVGLHGNLSEKKKTEVYQKIMTSSQPLLICATPSFAIIPKNDCGVVIFESVNSPYYINSFQGTIDYRVILMALWEVLGGARYLGDGFISSQEQTLIDRRVAFLERSEDRLNQQTKITIVKKDTFSDPEYQSALFSIKILDYIRTCIEHNKKIFIYAARKSIATTTVCRDCGFTVRCPNCHQGMQLIKKNPLSEHDRVFSCNVCHTESPAMNRCPECSGWNIIPLGITTHALAEELTKWFPDIPIYQSNSDLTKTDPACKKIVTTWQSTGGILIGTQKIIPFLRNIDVSLIASFEHCMSIPHYETENSLIWMLSKILENTRDQFIIQTKYADYPMLQSLSQYTLIPWLQDDMCLRKTYHVPPFATMITVELSSIARKDHLSAKDYLKKGAQSFPHTIQSQFFEHSQTYTLTMQITLMNKSTISTQEKTRLHQFLQGIRTHGIVTIDGPWIE